jgi:putative intracellular protease/amidase
VRIAIPIFDGLTALDAVGPYEVLSRLPGAEVTFVGIETGAKRTGVGSLALFADATLAQLPTPDVIVVPGGPGTRKLLDSPLIGWIRAAHESTTFTTSVCTGSLLLGGAGILKGIRATTHWLEHDRLRKLRRDLHGRADRRGGEGHHLRGRVRGHRHVPAARGAHRR